MKIENLYSTDVTKTGICKNSKYIERSIAIFEGTIISKELSRKPIWTETIKLEILPVSPL